MMSQSHLFSLNSPHPHIGYKQLSGSKVLKKFSPFLLCLARALVIVVDRSGVGASPSPRLLTVGAARGV